MSDLEVSRIEIVRVLTDDGQDQVWSTTRDPQGQPLPLVESLGMLRLAEDSLIREAMGEIE